MEKLRTAIVVGAAALAAATSTSATTPATPAAMGQKNIVQTAVAAGQFTTLVKLVRQAGLAGALSKPGALTVFAPTASLIRPRNNLNSKVWTSLWAARSPMATRVATSL